MMNSRDIEITVKEVIAALMVKREPAPEDVKKIIQLAGQLLVDVNRTANALERIAQVMEKGR